MQDNSHTDDLPQRSIGEDGGLDPRDQLDLSELLPLCEELAQSISATDAQWQMAKDKDWVSIVELFYTKLKEIASKVRSRHLLDPDSHESDSLVNEAFLKVSSARLPTDFASAGHFLSYMCKTIRTIRLESKRSHATKNRHLAQMSPATCGAAKVLAQDDIGQLRLQCDEILIKKETLLSRWSGHPDAVAMYQLYTEGDTTHREIADLYGVGKSTVTDRIAEVRDYLRRGLQELC